MPIKKLTGDFAQTTVGPLGSATQVLGLQEWSIAFKVKTVDATTTDDSAWESSLPSSASWTAKAKYVYLMGDPSQQNNILAAIILDRTPSLWRFFLDSDESDDSFYGMAYIDGIDLGAGTGKTVGMDVSLKGTGPLNFLDEAINRSNLVLPSGSVAFVVSRSLGLNEYAVLWEDFSLITTPLPDDAIIVGIYPVIIASGNYDATTAMQLAHGTGMSITALGGSSFTSPSNPDNTTFASTEFYDASIGTSLSALAAQQIEAMLTCSINIPPTGSTTPLMTDAIAVTGVGYAILYESGAPTIDAAMPPPFAVSSGQGLTWALPKAVAQTGGPFFGGFGIFSGSSGQGLGTPASGEV